MFLLHVHYDACWFILVYCGRLMWQYSCLHAIDIGIQGPMWPGRVMFLHGLGLPCSILLGRAVSLPLSSPLMAQGPRRFAAQPLVLC